MFTVLNFLVLLAGFFHPRITTIKTGPNDPVSGVEQNGALINNTALVQVLGAVATNGSPAFGNWSQTVIPASSPAFTIPAAALVGGIIRRFSPGAAFTDCTDTATNIIASIPGAKVNQTFPVLIANLGSGLETLAGGTGVTIAGTAAIGSATARLFLGQVTGSAAVTITGCFGWNIGVNGTLVLGL